jgi:hypothetical protein
VRRTIENLLLGAIALDIVYWTLWFTDRSAIASLSSEAYYQFENAFPLADAWLGGLCILAWIALRRRHPSALLWLIAAGGAGLYLGSMDVLYDLQHSIFAKSAGGAFEFLIVALTWSFSITALVWSWRHREELLVSSSAHSH